MEPNTEAGSGQSDVDALLAGLGGNTGCAMPPPGASPPPAGGAPPADSTNLAQEIDLGGGQKVKLSDLKAAYGRQGSLAKALSRFQQWEPVIKHLEGDEELSSQLLDEIEARMKGATPEGQDNKPPNMEELWRRSPRAWAEENFRQLREENRTLKLERVNERIDREVEVLKTKYKLDEKQIREVGQLAISYKDANGEPIAMETAYTLWNAPQLTKQQEQLKEQLNRRASGIPGSRASSGNLSTKDPAKMTESERKADMLDMWYKQQNQAT